MASSRPAAFTTTTRSTTPEDDKNDDTQPPLVQLLKVSDYDAAVEMEARAISTTTLLAGWTDEMTLCLREAVRRLVGENPLLTGRLLRRQQPQRDPNDCSSSSSQFVVEAGAHEEFCVELVMEEASAADPVDPAWLDELDRSCASVLDAVRGVHTHLEPVWQRHSIGSSKDCLQSGGPLFRILLLPLPSSKRTSSGLNNSENDSYRMAVCVELCHILADGASYYKIMEYLNGLMNHSHNNHDQFPATPVLVWKTPPEHVGLPVEYGPQDRTLHMSGWLAGYIRKSQQYSSGTANARVADLLVLDRDAVQKLKEEYGRRSSDDDDEPFISTNDLITAGMCELFDKESIFIINVNMRGRLPELLLDGSDAAPHHGSGAAPHHSPPQQQQEPFWMGNLQRAVLFRTGDGAAHPRFVRRLQHTWVYYGNGDDKNTKRRHIPSDQMAACHVSILSNWASLQHILCPAGGARVICHCPAKDYVEQTLGMDMAFVFQADTSGTLMFLSNFTAGKRGTELKERIESSKLFQRLFVPPASVESKQDKVGGATSV